MRCQQARTRLSLCQTVPSKLAGDRELMAHLNDCPACRLLAEVDRSLTSAFAELSQKETRPAPFFEAMVTRVEALTTESSDLTSSTNRQTKDVTVMSRIAKQICRRPRLSVSLGIVGLLLLVSMLVPFKYQDSIGYEVAFAGVDKTLALDEAKLNDILTRLGIENAVIDVTGCEATCNVKISEISSPDHAKMLVAAFGVIGNCLVTEEPKACFETKDGNMFFGLLRKLAEDDDQQEFDISNFDAGDLHQVVIELLGGEGEMKTIWIESRVSGTDEELQFFGQNGEVKFFGEDGEETFHLDGSGNERQMTVRLMLKGEDGDELDFESMKAAGCSLIVITQYLTDGAPDDDPTIDLDEESSAAKESSLPEGYALGQNYPNPFNPDTKINFSLGQAGHVTLEIFNVRGQVVRTLVDDYMSAGDHTVDWDATTSSGQSVASGIYLYRLTANDVTATKKMNLLK